MTSTTPNARKHVLPKSPRPNTSNPAGRNQTNNTVNTKPTQDSGGNYEAKLVEMINSSIVDASPSVKWEDVGKKFMMHSTFILSISVPFCSGVLYLY